MTTIDETKPAATAPPRKRRIDKMPANAFSNNTSAEFLVRNWFINLRDPQFGGPDTRAITIQDLMDPAFWGLHAARLSRFDTVRVAGGVHGTCSAYDITFSVNSKSGFGVTLLPLHYFGSALSRELDRVMGGDGPADLRQTAVDVADGVDRMNTGGQNA